MSDEAAEPDAPAGPPAPKPPPVLVGLLALNVALSAGALVMAMKAGKPAHAAKAHVEASGPPPREVTGPLITLDPFVVNLDEPGSSRYLKLQLQVEVSTPAAAKLFEKSKQLIRDDLLSYLSGLKVADTQGSDNKDQIRTELESAVAEVIGEDRVHRIVFIEFVVQ